MNLFWNARHQHRLQRVGCGCSRRHAGTVEFFSKLKKGSIRIINEVDSDILTRIVECNYDLEGESAGLGGTNGL